jgi:3-phosphoshikimate 1-carboxyvinyltransferase
MEVPISSSNNLQTTTPQTVTVFPAPITRGSVKVPSSKSHTIRALLIAAAADGVSTIHNLLDSADAESCMAALKALGARITITGRTETGMDVEIHSPGGGAFSGGRHDGPGDDPVAVDVGNSGTTLYLLSALSAMHPRRVCFDGDASIRRRSAAPLLNALKELGAIISFAGTGTGPETAMDSAGASGCAPYCITGPLSRGRTITVESPTSQYLSALLLAAPLIPGKEPGPSDEPEPTTINVALLNEHPYVDMTCWWLKQQNVTFHRDGYDRFVIPSGQHYHPLSTRLPGDYSSATFWFCAAALTGTAVTVCGLAPDDVQGDKGVLDILEQLGCTVTWTPPDRSGTASVTVSGKPLRGGTFNLNAMPDALPALAVLGCYAPGAITLEGVPQAREKETDRIAVMATELAKLGGIVTELPDGLKIEPRVLRGGTADSHGDHRIAMALAVGALGAEAPVTIDGADAAAVTYPAFFRHLHHIAPEALPAGEDE